MEVILCLGLFAIVVVVLFTVIGGGISMQRKAEVVELASSVARQQIETIKSNPAPVGAGTFDGRAPTPQTAQGFPPAPYPKVQRGRVFWTQVEISAYDDRLWHLRVRVFSDDGELTTMETLLKR